MAENKAPEAEETKGSSNKLKLFLVIGVILLLIAIGGGIAAYFLLDGSGGDESESGDAEVEEATTPELAPLAYHALDSMTVNITKPGPVRFLRVGITVAVRNPDVIAAVERHLPMIRNDLLTHLAVQEFEVLNRPEGKDALREELKSSIQDVLSQVGEPSEVEMVLFTDLVMQ